MQSALRELEAGALILNPGDYACSDKAAIKTLLGSCVAVAYWDPRLKIGAMNHFLLPELKGAQSEDDKALAGAFAMEKALNMLLARGSQKSSIVAKAFGAGSMTGSDYFGIGQKNAQFARSWLERERIALAASDFGGCFSRVVILDPSTGDVYCKRTSMQSSLGRQAWSQDEQYAKGLAGAGASPGLGGGPRIELF